MDIYYFYILNAHAKALLSPEKKVHSTTYLQTILQLYDVTFEYCIVLIMIGNKLPHQTLQIALLTRVVLMRAQGLHFSILVVIWI